jgi:tripartite-type tricarboxylate transporter receptor subunit TctC
MKPVLSPIRFAALHVLAALMLAFGAAAVRAESYPSRPVKIVVGYGPGSTLDVRLRQIGDRLAAVLQQPVVIENRPGAAGTMGAAYAAKAKPDGYTLFFGGATELAVEPAVRSDLPYDVLRDFDPIIQVGFGPAVLLVGTQSGVESIQELLSAAKARPGALTCGSFGTGSLTHLLLLQLNRTAGTQIVHVPYKNPASGLTDVAGGHTTMAFDYLVGASSLIAAGKLVPLVVVGDRRLDVLPNVPSAAEAGLPKLDRMGWTAVLAPKGTPPEIVRRLNAALGRVLASPEMIKAYASTGGRIVASSPEALGEFLRMEQKQYVELARATGLRGE